VDWLTNHEFVSATNLHSTDVAGKTGFSVDINLKADPGRSCAGSAEENLSSVGLYETTEIHRAGGSSFGGVYKIRVGEQNRWIILDVGGDAPLLFNLQCRIAECADYFPWAQELVDTVAITEDN
jgi:hypothetical protein